MTIVNNKSLFDTINVSQGSPVTWTRARQAGFLLEPQLFKIRMLITDEASASDRWASLPWIPERFGMIHARDSCIQSWRVLEGEGEKRKYIKDVHRTWFAFVGLCRNWEKFREENWRERKPLCLSLRISLFLEEITILRSSRGIQILDCARGFSRKKLSRIS